MAVNPMAPLPNKRFGQATRRWPIIKTKFLRRCRVRIEAHIKLKNATDHDVGLRPVPVLETHEAKRCIAIDEETAADAFWSRTTQFPWRS
jgi:hypothetical protein